MLRGTTVLIHAMLPLLVAMGTTSASAHTSAGYGVGTAEPLASLSVPLAGGASLKISLADFVSPRVTCQIAAAPDALAAGGHLRHSKAPATLRVPADYKTIQEAIDAAVNGDTVLVAAGVYYENLVWAQKVISVIGYDKATTIVNGGASGSCLTVDGVNSPAMVQNLTFTNGVATYGSGLYIRESEVVVGNCDIVKNGTRSIGGDLPFTDGGGIFIHNVGANGLGPTIQDCLIEGNKASNLGAGINCSWSATVITRCTIRGNNDLPGGELSGGGIYVSNSSDVGPRPVTITDNDIVGNTAGLDGGGIHLHGTSGGEVSGNRIADNVSVYGVGGGVFIDMAAVSFHHNYVVSNHADRYFGGGVALYDGYGGSLAGIDHCVIARNTGDPRSGGAAGIYEWTSGVAGPITNCTIADNVGGGVCGKEVSPVLLNSIVYGNTGAPDLINCTTSYTCVTPLSPKKAGDFAADPLFADASAGDYHLKSTGGRWDPGLKAWVRDTVTSPCVDAGDPVASAVNEPAPNGGVVNLGAYGNTAYASKRANRPPVVPTVTISPAAPKTGDDLTVAVTDLSDPDGDTVTCKYAWLRGGVRQAAFDGKKIVPASATTSGERWRCEVTPNDGFTEGPVGTDEVTIGNTAPTQPTVDVSPDLPKTTDDLTVIASGSTDVDKAINYTYRWFRDGQAQAAHDDQTTIPSSATAKGETWRCVVTPSDGTDNGPTGEDQVTVSNTAPLLGSVAIAPEFPSVHDGLTAVPADWEDADNDAAGYQYQWRRLSTASVWEDIPGATGATLAPGAFAAGDQIRVICTPDDGDNTGTPALADVAIMDAPALSWVGGGPYEAGPVDPLQGQADDFYLFKVRYRGATPQYVRLHLLRNGVEVLGSPIEMKPGGGSSDSGQVFWFKRKLVEGAYTCHFTASDGHDDAVGEPTEQFAGPFAGNAGPRLHWVGAAGPWESDPVDPEGQQEPGTEFTWKIRYSDAEGNAAEFVRLHLATRTVAGDGTVTDTEVAGSPFDMALESGDDPRQGLIYALTNSLADEGRYACWFSAREVPTDGYDAQDAVGPATWWHRNVIWLYHQPPKLAWVDEVATAEGADKAPACSPAAGRSGDSFCFRVRYCHPQGLEPVHVRLHLLRWDGTDYVETPDSPYALTAVGDEYSDCEYACEVPIEEGGRYRHRFSASDGTKDAVGLPTWKRMPGPLVSANTMPRLNWLGTYGYEADGVSRDPRSPADTFTWGVRYTDADDDAPRHVRVHVARVVGGDEIELASSPFDMTGESEDWLGGVAFTFTRQLTQPGLYAYWFAAADQDDPATGPPTQTHMRGPHVAEEAGSTPLMVTSAVALATRSGGVQVTFTMSARGSVTAEVLNIAGRRVGVIVSDREMAAGANSLNWNGRNSSGLPVPSGRYLIRLAVCDEAGARAQGLTSVQIGH